MKIIFLLVPALLASLILPAQKKYFTKGEIITNTGDTVQGFIERLRDNALGDGIHFEKALNSREQQLLTPDSVSGFVFSDENRVYESIAYTDTTNGTVVHKKIFANLLLKGYCSLYVVYLKPEDVHIITETRNNHIFLAKKSGEVTVLAEYESVVNSIYYLDKQYVALLTRLFRDCSSIDSADIAQTGFYSKAMIKLFAKYNLCHNPDLAPTIYKTKEKIKFTSTVYGGYNMFIAKAIQPIGGLDIGIFFSIIHPRVNERLALSFGFNYRHFQYSLYNTIDGVTENHNVNLIGVPINITYYFSNNTIAPFLDLGLVPAFTTDTYLDNKGAEKAKDFLIFSSFGPGVNISHVYLSALVELDGIVMVKTGSYFRFRIGYRF
ncbi:MAG: hypothetical protein ABI267_06205 [Ginsengibacter sp.]